MLKFVRNHSQNITRLSGLALSEVELWAPDPFETHKIIVGAPTRKIKKIKPSKNHRRREKCENSFFHIQDVVKVSISINCRARTFRGY